MGKDIALSCWNCQGQAEVSGKISTLRVVFFPKTLTIPDRAILVALEKGTFPANK